MIYGTQGQVQFASGAGWSESATLDRGYAPAHNLSFKASYYLPAFLAQMHGKTIGALLREDGSARLQWPESDGSLPGEMGRYQVADARINGGVVEMDLVSPEASFTFRFDVGAVLPPFAPA